MITHLNLTDKKLYPYSLALVSLRNRFECDFLIAKYWLVLGKDLSVISQPNLNKLKVLSKINVYVK